VKKLLQSWAGCPSWLTVNPSQLRVNKYSPHALALLLLLLAWCAPAQATFPVVAGTATSSRASNAANDSVTLPASVASGDLLLVFHYSDGSLTRTFPSPWVEIKDAVCSSSVCNIGVGYLIASGGETSVTVTKSVSERFTAISYRITGWHGTTPPEISTGATGSSTTPNPDTITASWGSDDNLFIAVMAVDDSGGGGSVSTWPANYTGSQITSPTASSAARGAVATRNLAASNDDPGTFTWSASDQWWAGTVAVRPAAAGGGATPPPTQMMQGVGD